MISVIIPTLNAEFYMEDLMNALLSQLYVGQIEIIVIDSESDDRTVEIATRKGATVLSVKRKDFDHGGTRNIAWRAAKGDIICFMTQDAIPADENYLYMLTRNLSDPNFPELKMVSGRQVADETARPVEYFTREFNYPEGAFFRTKEDIPRLGIKAYFFSDACSAYKREILEEMGGFEEPILTNEDMLMAARVINKGYTIGYEGMAMVFHCHNFKLRYHYARNFDVAAFLKMYEDEIESKATTGEGIKMVKYIAKNLLKHGLVFSFFRLINESAAKYLGNRAGSKYDIMPLDKVLKKTTNKGYWMRKGTSND